MEHFYYKTDVVSLAETYSVVVEGRHCGLSCRRKKRPYGAAWPTMQLLHCQTESKRAQHVLEVMRLHDAH